MVEIMKDYWSPYLVPVPDDSSDETPLPAVECLRKCILVKGELLSSGESCCRELPNSSHRRDFSASSIQSGEDESQVCCPFWKSHS